MVTAFLFFCVISSAFGFIGATLLKAWRIRVEAREEWANRLAGGEPPLDGVDEALFRRVYVRAYGPTGAMHGVVALLGAAVLTVPALVLLGAGWRIVWRLTGELQTYAEGQLIWQFYIFFGLIISWVIVAALVMRRHHANRPREFRQELLLEVDRARSRERVEAGDDAVGAAGPRA